MSRCLLVLVVLVGGFLVPLPTAAAPSAEGIVPSITIERDEFASEFPEGMRFRLTVSAERPIRDVVLRYYLQGSSIAVRTRPTFTAGTRVAIDWQLRTGRSRYVPPMSQVRYEYELTDETGATITTPQRTVTYTDQRFTWQRVEVEGLELLYHDLPEAQVLRQLQTARERLRRAEALFGTSLAAPVRGVVYNGREIQSALSFRSDTTTAEGHFGGEAYVDLRLFTIAGVNPAGVVHEATHVLLADALGRGKSLVPSWLNEGLAQWAEPQRPQTRFTRAFRLGQMGGVPSRGEDVGLHYAQGLSVTTFLIDRYGDEAMRTFLHALGRGDGQDGAARTAYGKDLTAIENEWRAWVGLPAVEPLPTRGRDRSPVATPVPPLDEAQVGPADQPAPEAPAVEPAAPAGGLPLVPVASAITAVLLAGLAAGAVLLRTR